MASTGLSDRDVTIHHNWDKTQEHRLAALRAPGMGRFIHRSGADEFNPMPLSKRVFDVALVLVLLVPLSLVMFTVALILLVVQGRPIFYSAQRMSAPSRSFTQLKFRTMLLQDGDFGATGAHKHWRITPIGHFLRRTRIDELPQLFNILKGDMSFVGPRPPLREYVERFPAIYTQVLKSRPGVTGAGDADLSPARRQDPGALHQRRGNRGGLLPPLPSRQAEDRSDLSASPQCPDGYLDFVAHDQDRHLAP